MPKFLLTIAYDGAGYAGWQRQNGRDTVQARLEHAVAEIVGSHAHVHGAGRTDAGVHALRQCAHVEVERDLSAEVFARAVNAKLPNDIAVRSAETVDDEFHARFSATGKRYVYRVWTNRVRPVHRRAYCAWVRVPLDLAAMRESAACLVGEHDFAAFATNPGYTRTRGTVRRVDRLHLIDRRHGFDLFIQGNGFLYNMVRTIAGTLIWVGKGKLPADAVAHILASRDRREAGPNAPPQGLFLQRVLYRAGRAGDRPTLD